MKKIIFLMLITCAFSSLINAYEIKVYTNGDRSKFYLDENTGKLQFLQYTESTNDYYYNRPVQWFFWVTLSDIKRGLPYYISNSEFVDYFKQNNQIINDFYVQATQQILNYFYNNNSFNSNSYVQYDDYELLYNSDGLAVESIVNGVWAGLYEDSERGSSGRFYDSSGVLLYVNAEPVNTFQQWLDPFVRSVVGCLMTAVNLIASPVGVVISVVFVMAILYFVVTVGRRAIQPFEGKVRKRFLGRHNEEV